MSKNSQKHSLVHKSHGQIFIWELNIIYQEMNAMNIYLNLLTQWSLFIVFKHVWHNFHSGFTHFSDESNKKIMCEYWVKFLCVLCKYIYKYTPIWCGYILIIWQIKIWFCVTSMCSEKYRGCYCQPPENASCLAVSGISTSWVTDLKVRFAYVWWVSYSVSPSQKELKTLAA